MVQRDPKLGLRPLHAQRAERLNANGGMSSTNFPVNTTITRSIWQYGTAKQRAQSIEAALSVSNHPTVTNKPCISRLFLTFNKENNRRQFITT
jgi:hypothetical protein